MTTGWTISDLARELGIPQPTLSDWVRAGLITPDRRGRGRPGCAVGITGLMETVAVHELRRAGFSAQAVRRVIGNLRDLTGLDRPLARLSLVVIGNDVVWCDPLETERALTSALRAPGQRVMLLPVGAIFETALTQLTANSPADRAPMSAR